MCAAAEHQHRRCRLVHTERRFTTTTTHQGYDRVYFTVSGTAAQYRTLDFIATSTETTIKFQSWGHINIFGPADTPNPSSNPHATELGLDDVRLMLLMNGEKGRRLATGH